MLIVGLTGGIATGKSLVAEKLASLGAVVVDADDAARSAVAPGRPALEEIRARFGDKIIRPDGTLDRPALARLVFHDGSARRDLEKIVHPRVFERMAEAVSRARQTNPEGVVVLVVPLLFETGYERSVDRTAVVVCRPDQQMERVMRRDGLPREEALARLSAQWPIEEKRRKADDVIENTASPEEALKQVEVLFPQWVLLARRQLT
ncbi:MAG: dephospho-CoA kinase [Nitrospirae bacterium RBG_16_64_22]|nr:MAG: dephospho-CoA kinase [Nitrospirae bacterium RBG_16_64_22]